MFKNIDEPTVCDYECECDCVMSRPTVSVTLSSEFFSRKFRSVGRRCYCSVSVTVRQYLLYIMIMLFCLFY